MGSMALLNIETLISDTTHFFLKVTNHYSKFWKLLLVKIGTCRGDFRIYIQEVAWGGELVEGRKKRS